ncbi:uncharacterized protein PFL1_00835 [Pseudozyma flocculosa PF-1]|uniref:Uncharacterized protein n=1 Tax=Pseudozyma flocculosa TaxID=84751 RepID=A0A5C3F307_9BASI|nr:uncharacterized protein PFL1_00835 [Pseudozyma flocculosa PF-1]EPQ31502.1 hypothetical protein PFL1_00835 [Pseudozyma flocculosa PF-1]SPO38712.1 uncharacterized protein PSFLO_04191 [Pseudozyma flocculosa]
MDPWSSPWSDEAPAAVASTSTLDSDVPLSGSEHQPVDSASLGFSLPLDSSDPWLKDDPQHLPAAIEPGHGVAQRLAPSELHKVPSTFLADSRTAWASEAETEVSSLSAVPLPAAGTPTTSPAHYASDDGPDPWSAADSASAGALTAPKLGLPLSSRHPFSLPEPISWDKDASSWQGDPDQARVSSNHSATTPDRTDGVSGTGTLPSCDPESSVHRSTTSDPAHRALETDAWATEATERARSGAQLTSDELSQLKVDARRMVSGLDETQTLAAAFKMDLAGDEGWDNLFGADGTKAGVWQNLRAPPPTASRDQDTTLEEDQSREPLGTSALTRKAVRQTEGKGANLTSSEGSSLWKRRSNTSPKAEWETGVAVGTDINGTRNATDTRTQASEQDGKGKAGPGWYQASAKETKPALAGGLLASLFRGRQASSTEIRSPSVSAGTPSPRASTDQQPTRTSTEPVTATMPSPALAAVAAFDATQTNTGDDAQEYTDDPFGSSLHGMTQNEKGVPAEDKPSLLSRWRNRNLFGTRLARPRSGAPTSQDFSEDDLNWLDSKLGSQYTEEGSLAYDNTYDGADTVVEPTGAGSSSARFATRFGNLIDGDDGKTDDNDVRDSLFIRDLAPTFPVGEGITHEHANVRPDGHQGASAGAAEGRGIVRPASSTFRWSDLDWDDGSKQQSAPKGIAPGPEQAARGTPRILPPPPSKRASLPPPPRTSRPLTAEARTGPSRINEALIPEFGAAQEGQQGDGSAMKAAATPDKHPIARAVQGNSLTADELSFFDSL